MVRLYLLLICSFISLSAHAQARADLDRYSIYENETVTLTITVDETKLFGGSDPDIRVLEKNFSISNQKKSSQSQWINGKSSAQTQWQYTLAPKQAGVVSIPSLTLGKYKTQPLSLQVKTVENPGGLTTDPIFLEVQVDKTQALVQEQIMLSIKVNYAIPLSNIEIAPLQLDNARVLSANDSQYTREINGQSYNTYEINYAIFPQQSGEFTIPAIPVAAIIPRTRMDVMMQQGQRKRLQSQAITLHIQQANNQQRLAAENLSLQESWSADPQALQVGDSITRSIRQEAQGLLAEQLAGVPLEKQRGFRIYNEQPQFENHTNALGNTGTRIDSYAMVLTQAGTVTLPEIRIPWWNSKTQQAEEAVLPAITLQVGGGAAANPSSPTSTETATTSTITQNAHEDREETENNTLTSPQDTITPAMLRSWQLATLISVTGVCILAGLLLRRRSLQQTEPTPIAGVQLAWQAFEKTSRSHDAKQVRQALLLWAKMAWPEKTIHSLADIKRILNNDALTLWLDALDASIFRGEHREKNWHELAQLLKQYTASNVEQAKPSLYPTR